MALLRLRGVLEHLGQLKYELGQVFTFCVERVDSKGFGNAPDGGLEQVSSGDTFQRVDQSVVEDKRLIMAGLKASSTQLMEQGCDHRGLGCGLGAMNDAVPTRCSKWL